MLWNNHYMLWNKHYLIFPSNGNWVVTQFTSCGYSKFMKVICAFNELAKLCRCGNTTLVQTHTVLANSKVFLKYVVGWDWLLMFPLSLNFGLTNLQKVT